MSSFGKSFNLSSSSISEVLLPLRINIIGTDYILWQGSSNWTNHFDNDVVAFNDWYRYYIYGNRNCSDK